MGGPGTAWGEYPTTPPNIRGRQAPIWMDGEDRLGELLYLVLSPNEKSVLPKNPFIIEKSLTNHAGNIEPCKPIDKGSKYLVKTRSRAQFEKLQSLTKLIDGTSVNIIAHPYLNSVQCVIVCNSLEGLSDDDILSEMKEQKVVSVKRFLRKENGEIKPTNSFLLKIDAVQVPHEIRVGCLVVKTRTYYPRPMICTQCLIIGHTKNRCNHETCCANCGEKEHGVCSSPIKCKNCSGSHVSLSRSCPTYIDEQMIIKIKIDNSISYTEAKSVFENKRAHSVNERIQNAQQESVKDQIIADLKKKVAQLEEKMDIFLKANDKLQKDNDKLKHMYLQTIKPKTNTNTTSEPIDSSDNENTAPTRSHAHIVNLASNLNTQIDTDNGDNAYDKPIQKRKVDSYSSTDEQHSDKSIPNTDENSSEFVKPKTTRRPKNRKTD